MDSRKRKKDMNNVKIGINLTFIFCPYVENCGKISVLEDANTVNSPILQTKNSGKIAHLAKNTLNPFVNAEIGPRKKQRVQYMQESALHALHSLVLAKNQ